MRRDVPWGNPRILEAFIKWVMAVIQTRKPNSLIRFVSAALYSIALFTIAVWNTLAAHP